MKKIILPASICLLMAMSCNKTPHTEVTGVASYCWQCNLYTKIYIDGAFHAERRVDTTFCNQTEAGVKVLMQRTDTTTEMIADRHIETVTRLSNCNKVQ